MKQLITLFVTTTFVLFFSSCNKNDSPPPTNTDYIIRAAWKFDKATSGGFDVSGTINACYKDNIMTFQANGNGVLDEGATKCNSGDPQTTNFTWNFTNNATTLNISATLFAGQTGSLTVLTLNETQMVLEATTSSGNVQIYFKH